MEQPKVEVGEIWRDWGLRFREHPVGRQIKVISVGEETVEVRVLTNQQGEPVISPKITKIKRNRFREISTGYKRVEPVGTFKISSPATGKTSEAMPYDAPVDVVLRNAALLMNADPKVNAKTLKRAEAEVARLEAVVARRQAKINVNGNVPKDVVAVWQKRARRAYVKLNQAKARLEAITS